ncbi:hypothetical protein BC940DRAFT_320941 [Gongronella butleri]|nr:hypothetical protein BC940DRAFT_320941 [Gongronella butleri]
MNSDIQPPPDAAIELQQPEPHRPVSMPPPSQDAQPYIVDSQQPAQQQQQQQAPPVATQQAMPPVLPAATQPDTQQQSQPPQQQQLQQPQQQQQQPNAMPSSAGDFAPEKTGMPPPEKQPVPPQYPGLAVQPAPTSSTSSGGYPGNVGGSVPTQDALVYDPTTGQPMLSAVTAQRQQIEQSLGPTCPKGGYHTLRMHYTTSSLLMAILIVPYCCGYRGRRVCECTKCSQKFPSIVLPEP